MKAIFLDIDGVLNSEAYRNKCDDYYENFIDESTLPLLKYIVEQTDAKIVLTSTWRMYWNEGETQLCQEGEQINKLFKKHGLSVYAKTNDYGECRDYEILDWLTANGVNEYVILDDMSFEWSERNSKHFVQTDDSKNGLDEESVRKAIDILNKFSES